MRYSWIVDWDQRPSILGRNCQVHRPLVRGCLGESTITIVFEGTLFERPTYSGKGDVTRWNAVLLGCSGSRRWSWCSGPCTTPRWGRLQAECCTDRRSSWRWSLTGKRKKENYKYLWRKICIQFNPYESLFLRIFYTKDSFYCSYGKKSEPTLLGVQLEKMILAKK